MAPKKLASTTDLAINAYNWLTLSGQNINAAYCKDEITAHPEYPALTALTDFLESGGMEYEAVQADVSYINEFQYPLLAHIKKSGQEYLHLVNDVSVWDKEKETTKDWSGIALYAGKNATWKHDENGTRQKQAKKNKFIAFAFLVSCIALFAASAFLYQDLFANMFGFLSLAGLAISIAALGTELGYQSKLVKEVCGAVGKGGCEKVLKSRFAKGFLGITPADASVIYFAAQFLAYLIGSLYIPILNNVIAIAAGGIAVAACSIYTQAVKLKEWCALCLGIASILILQASLSGIYLFSLPISLSFASFLFFGILALLLTLIFLPVKQLIKTNREYLQQINSFKKWKTDAGLFLTQWEKEPACDTTIWENDLIIGEKNAPITITVACNPYCGPCANAHKELDELLEKHSHKINVQVRLLCDAENEKDKRRIAADAILQKAEELEKTGDVKQMLTEWFEDMNIEKWQQKWQPVCKNNVADKIQLHQAWVNEAGITHTPTFFINGKKLPGRYNIKDIEKMLPQLENTFAEQKTYSEN